MANNIIGVCPVQLECDCTGPQALEMNDCGHLSCQFCHTLALDRATDIAVLVCDKCDPEPYLKKELEKHADRTNAIHSR